MVLQIYVEVTSFQVLLFLCPHMLLHPCLLLVLVFFLVSLSSQPLVSLHYAGLIKMHVMHVSVLTVYSGLNLKLNLKI